MFARVFYAQSCNYRKGEGRVHNKSSVERWSREKLLGVILVEMDWISVACEKCKPDVVIVCQSPSKAVLENLTDLEILKILSLSGLILFAGAQKSSRPPEVNSVS